MKLLSLEVKNYRVHRETVVDLDAPLVFIGGPNETGKSTLIEAAHRAFFLRAGAGGAAREGMKSRHGGDPEVKVRFEHDGKCYQLGKTFKANGTTVLVEEGGQTWQGAPAEERLQAITGTEALGGQGAERRLPVTWAHLWTWQGKAGEDPTEVTNPHHGDLLARLQADGGAVVMQSQNDARLADAIRQEITGIFKENSKPKTNSSLGQAVEKRVQAESRAAQAAEIFARLRQAADDHARAILDERHASEDKLSVLAQLAEVEAKLEDIARWEIKTRRREQLLLRRKNQLDILQNTAAQADQLAAQRQAKEAGLLPGQKELENLRAIHEQQVGEAGASEEAVLGLANEASRLRRERDGASAWLNHFEKQTALDALGKTRQLVEEKRAEKSAKSAALAALPMADGKLVKKFHEAETQRAQARIALDAMATGLEVVAAPQPVSVGGEMIPAGGSIVLAEATEITIGDGVKLRIKPGGGNALGEARVRLATAEATLAELAGSHGFATAAEAEEARLRRAALEESIRMIQSHLDGLGGAGIEDKFAAAGHELAEAVVVLQQRTAACPDMPPPPDLASARQLFLHLGEQTAAAEKRELEARAVATRAREAIQAAQVRWATRQQALAEEEKEVHNLATRSDILLEPFGNRQNLAMIIDMAIRRHQRADILFGRTREALAARQPDLTAIDQKRLTAQLAALQTTASDAELRKRLAAQTLAQDGVSDPRAELSRAQQTLLRAQAEEQREQSRADALKLLDDLFREERQSLSASFIQPLADKINAYLQCLFGPDARVNIAMKDDHSGFECFKAVRHIDGPGELPFDQLSGGAKEQIAAAIRLAIVEVLAGGYGGTLPVFFDDAFAYSDPERVAAVQRMLFLASQRGLQVIVLACNPRDYAALGAGKSHPLKARSV